MTNRRTIVEVMLAMDDEEKALHFGKRLLGETGKRLLDYEVEGQLVALSGYARMCIDSPLDFTVLGMKFLANFQIGDMEVSHDSGIFDIFIPVIAREPESLEITTDATRVDFEERMAGILLRGLQNTENDWMFEFYTEAALCHPVYLSVTERITKMIETMAENSSWYELQDPDEVIEYFDIVVFPRLKEILKPFEA